MHISIGDICILDPTNEIYRQNEVNSILYVIILNKRGFFFPKYDCIPCTFEGEPISNKPVTLTKKVLRRVNPVVPAVVIRYPANLPVFSDSDIVCIDQLLALFHNMRDQEGVEVNTITGILYSLKNKIRFYYDMGFKEKVENNE